MEYMIGYEDNKCGVCRNQLPGCSGTYKMLEEQLQQTNFPMILERHFWPHITSDGPTDIEAEDEQHSENSSTPVCDDCYSKIMGFHDFYTAIEEIHRIFVAKIDIEVIKYTEADEAANTYPPIHNEREEINYSIKEVAETENKTVQSISIDIEPFPEMKEESLEIYEYEDKDLSISRDDNSDSSDYAKVRKSNRFICRKCYSRFDTLKDLRSHKKLCTVPEPELQIQQIEENFTKYNVTKEEILRYCPICQQVFPYRSNYGEHVRTAHKDVDTRVSCDICKTVAKDIYALGAHMRVNHYHPPVVCQICGKVYSHNFFARHVLSVHSDTREVCEICGRSFKVGHAYTEHMSIHSGVHLYPCRFCERSFRLSSEMYRHVKKYHFTEYKEYRNSGKTIYSRKTTKPVPVIHKLKTFKNREIDLSSFQIVHQ